MAERKTRKGMGDAMGGVGAPADIPGADLFGVELAPPPAPSAVPAAKPDAKSDAKSDEAHYQGHRARLYTRFLEGGPDALQDHELLEMVLFAVNPRRDVKPLAKALLREFGDLWSVVNAPPERLRGYSVDGVSLASDKAVAMIRVVGAAALRGMRQRVMNRPVLASWQALLDYCTAAMAHKPTEQFRLLFLDRKNKLIADEVQQTGTVDHTPVYPREVVKRALELSASAVILVHNHPSGDPTPSRADIEMTKEILRAAHAVGVMVHDHVIVGRGKHVSFKAQGLM